MSYNYNKIENVINERFVTMQVADIDFDNVIAMRANGREGDLFILKKRNDIKYSYRISKTDKSEKTTNRVHFIKRKLNNGLYVIIKCVFNKKCDVNTVLNFERDFFKKNKI